MQVLFFRKFFFKCLYFFPLSFRVVPPFPVFGLCLMAGSLRGVFCPLESWCGGTDRGAERLLMMSRRSRAGDRPLAYPHLLQLRRLVLVLAAEKAVISLSIELLLPSRVSPSSIAEMASPNPFPRDHPLEPEMYHMYMYLPQVIFYVLVYPPFLNTKFHPLQASM